MEAVSFCRVPGWEQGILVSPSILPASFEQDVVEGWAALPRLSWGSCVGQGINPQQKAKLCPGTLLVFHVCVKLVLLGELIHVL